MRKKLASVMQSGSVKDVLVLSSGRLAASVVSLLSAPFIARLFDPAHYGVAALFIAIATPAAIVLPLSYQNAIVIPKEKESAYALMRLSIIAAFVLCLLVYVLMASTQVAAIRLPFAERLDFWIWVVPLAMLALALSQICEGWLTRKRGFVSSSQATFMQAATTSGGRLSIGVLWGSSIWGLIAPYLAGVILRLGFLARAAWQRRDVASEISQNGVPIKVAAKEYREFPVYNLPAGFLRALSDNLPVLFFAPVFGAEAAGFYAMADRLIKSPLTMGSMSIHRVYLQRASVIFHEGGDLKRSYARVTGYLAILGLPPLLLILLAGQQLMEFVLGERWARAGQFAEILAPWLYLVLITRPAVALLVLLRKQVLWLKLQSASAVLRVMAMLVAWRITGGQDEVIWGFVLGGAIPYLWLMLNINQLIDKQSDNINDKSCTSN